MTDLLTRTAASLENGVFTAASIRAGVVSIVAVNLKMRDERVTELTITLPASVAGYDIVYYLIDASNADTFDGSADPDLAAVTPPTVVAGTVTLWMWPRSVHLLQFSEPPPPPFIAPSAVFHNAGVTINGTDVTANVNHLQFVQALELLDITLLGDRFRRWAPGMQTVTVAMSYFQSYGTGSVDAVLRPLLGSSGFDIVVVPNRSLAVSPTNPSYTATYVFTDYTRFTADVRDASVNSVTFTAISDVTVATS